MNSWVFGRGDGRAIAMDVAERVIQSLRADGRIKRAYLGVGTQQVQLPEVVRARAGQESGLLVITVDPGSPADKAGIMQGDTLVAIAGSSSASLDDLYRKVRTLKVGAQEPVKLIRAGEVKEVKLTVGEASREQN
jgi:S1-C subfamily serine protease